MASITDNVGGSDVPTFVLQNTVHGRPTVSFAYLDELSDCMLLRLELVVVVVVVVVVLDAGDRIIRTTTSAVLKSNGSWKTRPLSSLSGT
jgi:hypothetical protein